MADGDAHEQILTAGAIIPAEGPRFDGQGESMARRRYQKGRVILRGKVNSVWVGRWREDVIGADGVTRRIERSEFSAASREFPRSGSRSGAWKFCYRGLTRRIIGQAAWRPWTNLPRGGKKRCFLSANRARRKQRALICAVISCRSLETCSSMRSARKRSRYL